jgi:hypothetical protein
VFGRTGLGNTTHGPGGGVGELFLDVDGVDDVVDEGVGAEETEDRVEL